MITCPNCQSQNQPGKRFCTNCGLALSDIQLTESGSVTPENGATHPTNGRHTKPLASPLSFMPLPDGAIVSERFLVRQQLESTPYIFSYLVEDTNDPDQPDYYILREAQEFARFGIELDIANLPLQAAGLRPPFHVFQQVIGGITRTFLLSPQPGTSLSHIATSLELPKVINWGVTLANALAALHQHQIAFGQMNRQDIQVDRDNIFLSNFSHCLKPGNLQLYQEDVRQLAMVLHQLLTGQNPDTPTTETPEPIQQLLLPLINQSKVLTAVEFAQSLTQIVNQLRRPTAINLQVGRRTDVGMTRQLNEDSLLVMDIVWNNRSLSQAVGLFVVADGMGGHEGGEIASGMVTQTLAHQALQNLLEPTTGLIRPTVDVKQWLSQAVQTANWHVFQQSHQAQNDMGSTVVAALMQGNQATIAHVGDSRAYHISQEEIRQVTVDHSLVERLVATNQISREEARHHPQSNVIYRTIGDKKQVEVDVGVIQIPTGDYLLLCSDGLSGMATDERIHQIVTTAHSPQQACDLLIQAANAAGGEDNVTVIIIKSEVIQ